MKVKLLEFTWNKINNGTEFYGASAPCSGLEMRSEPGRREL